MPCSGSLQQTQDGTTETYRSGSLFPSSHPALWLLEASATLLFQKHQTFQKYEFHSHSQFKVTPGQGKYIYADWYSKNLLTTSKSLYVKSLCMHDAYTCLYTCAHTCTCMHVTVHACTCMCMHVHACACMCMCMHAHACTCMCMCMRAYMCQHTQKNTHFRHAKSPTKLFPGAQTLGI